MATVLNYSWHYAATWWPIGKGRSQFKADMQYSITPTFYTKSLKKALVFDMLWLEIKTIAPWSSMSGHICLLQLVFRRWGRQQHYMHVAWPLLGIIRLENQQLHLWYITDISLIYHYGYSLIQIQLFLTIISPLKDIKTEIKRVEFNSLAANSVFVWFVKISRDTNIDMCCFQRDWSWFQEVKLASQFRMSINLSDIGGLIQSAYGRFWFGSQLRYL